MTVGPVTIAGAGRRPTAARTTTRPRCPTSDRKCREELESSTRGDRQLQSRYVRRNSPTRAPLDLASREMQFSAASRERSCAPSLGSQVFLWLCWPALTCCSCVPPRMCSPSDPVWDPDPGVFLWLCCPALTCCSCVPRRVCSPSDFDSDPEGDVFLWLCSPAFTCCSCEPP